MVDLEEAGEGIYKSKKDGDKGPLFVLSTEISSIYSQGDKTRRIHNIVFAPSFKVVEKINKELVSRGANLMSDGRPIVGLSAKDLVELVLTIDKRCLFIPAHAWTPWFSLYGSMSGFDTLEECFGEFAKDIPAVETGLSSDPAMNWRIEDLENRRLVSFGDAHSPAKLGREVTVFDLEELTYTAFRQAIWGEGSKNKILHTIEFYPEEGKYHFTGHRKCDVRYSPKEARKKGTICPVCGRPLTVGVMGRVESLARLNMETKSKTDKYNVRWVVDKSEKRPPYVMIVPLLEILSEALGVGVNTKTVSTAYEQMINALGSEFDILLKTSLIELQKASDPKVVEAIKKVRAGDIAIEPGYDGVFGKVQIWKGDREEKEPASDQSTLF